MHRHNRSPGFRHSYSPTNSNSKNQHEFERHSKKYNNQEIRSLCVSNIHNSVSDSFLTSFIDKEFSCYGKYNLSITSFNFERVAYVNFKRSDYAAEALKYLQNLEIDNRPLTITPVFVYEPYNSTRHQYRGRSRSPLPPPPSHRFPNRNNEKLPHRDSSSEVLDRRSRSNSPRHSHRDRDFKPQYDTLPTRTLFLGNLPIDIENDTLKRKFEKFGEIMDIDVRRQSGRQGNSYAFLRYATLDMASHAKHEMDGKFISGSQIKIGYGKPIQSTCVWIGGLGPWVVFEELEREIIRIGNVKQIEWPRNKSFAFVIFDNVNAAITAVETLRNVSLGGNDHRRLKVDYCDLSYFTRNYKLDRYPRKSRRSISSKPYSSPQQKQRVSIDTAKTTSQLSECLRGIWTGKIILKKNNFGCRFYKFKGDESLVTDFLFEEKQNSFQPISLPLRITQRMSIDVDKMREIKQRIESLRSREYCIMFGTSFVLNTTLMDDALHPNKPIQNLIEYLKLKNSSGIVFLKSNSSSSTNTTASKGTVALHIFPPCDFVFDILNYKAPNLNPKYMMDDFVLILLMQNVLV